MIKNSSQDRTAFPRRKLLPTALGSLLAMGSSAAFAQLEEVIVTAQGREQNLQEVPVAVSVISNEQLEAQGLVDLQAVSTRLGNVKITSGTLVNSMNVRGVGSGENPGFEQAVATFADGVYRSRSRSTIAGLFDIDRVEVLKGPQTTFFGANAIAGALNITTRKPGREFEGNLSALYGFTDGEYNLEGGVSTPLTETLSARVALRARGGDGFIDQELGGEGPDEESYQTRLSLHWTPNDVWTSDLRFDYAQSDFDNFAPFQLLNCPAPGFPMSPVCGQLLAGNPGIEDKLDDKSWAQPGSYMDFDFFEVAFTNAFELGGGTLRTVSAYSDASVESYISLVPGTYPTAVNGGTPFPTWAAEEYEFMSQEIRFESATGGKFEYMVGAYFSTADLEYSTMVAFNFLPFGAIVEDVFQVDFPNFGPNTSISGYPQMKQSEDMRSVFASGTFYPTDDVRINLGARYTEVEKSANRGQVFGHNVSALPKHFQQFPDDAELVTLPGTNIQVPMTPAQAAGAVIGSSVEDFAQTHRVDRKFMPSAGIQYDIADDVMLYGTYSKGFKAGGFSATSSPSVFGPEEVDAYEIGAKSTLLDRTLTLNLALFYMEYKGLQETTFDANLASSITNVAGSTSQGIELSANWSVTPNFQLYADIAWLDAQYDDYPVGECTKQQLIGNADCVQDLSGADRAYAPEWSGSLSADVIFPMGEHELRITPVMSFSSSYFMTATADPLFSQDGYEKYDLRIAYGPSDRKWEVALLGRNLTDEITAMYKLGVPGGDGSVTSLAERGRWFGMQFMSSF